MAYIRSMWRNEALFGPRPVSRPWVEHDFPIVWEDQGDSARTWDLDEMHSPSAHPPMGLDYAAVIAAGFNVSFGYFEIPLRIQFRAFNGYGYRSAVYGVPDAEIPALLAEMRERFRSFGPRTLRYWNDKAMPALRSIYDQIVSIDVDGLHAQELGGAWRTAWEGIAEAWGIHFIVVRGAYRVSEDLTDLYARVVPGSGKAEGLRLIQAQNDVLLDVDIGLERITASAAAQPAVADRLRRAPLPSVEELRDLDGGPAFLAMLEPFLAQHGHLGHSIDDLRQPSWAEEPALVLSEIAKRLGSNVEPAMGRRERLRTESDAMADDVRRRLAARPDELETFDNLLALAMDVGPLTETHHYWIDRMAQARLRALAMKVGSRLAREGTLERATDIFFLQRDEVPEVLLHPRPMHAVVAEREVELARQAALTPPSSVGRPNPDSGVAAAPQPGDRGLSEIELRGTGASAGVVQGPARIAMGPEDFGRIQAGDIIVCPSSNPSWVPMFTIAAGLVTNTGGILAHAAVVAREFGLPAVVGLAGATSRIADGRRIEIDGTTGTVRFLA
jgi:phosphohistidine swiveling domain-containing protein